MTHTIQQHYLHVEVNGTESDALALQHRLSGLCQDWLLPAFERAFDQCVPAHENWSIERLDIDAGILDIERLEQDLAALVEQSIKKTLLSQTPSRAATTPTTISGYVEQKTTRQAIDEAFVYFLKTGSLPWAFRLPKDKNLEQTVLTVWQENTKSPINSDTIIGVLAFAGVRKRLISQFSPVFLAILLARLSPEGKKVMDGILPALRSFDAPPVAVKQFEKQLWETAFALIGTAGALTEKIIVGETWRTLSVSMAQQPLPASLLEQHWPGLMQDVGSHLPATQKTGQILDKPLPLATREISIPDTPVIPEDQSWVVHKTSKSQHPETAENINIDNAGLVIPENGQEKFLTKALENHPVEFPEAGVGIYIENAGLVLLHPFLPRLFEGLGLAAEDKLIQPERALCLLHFLTTGQTIAPEYELILSKILCNIPLATPVESDMALTGSEKEEAEALLEAVIHHWEVLQNTSIDGLRGTFLLRAGKLSLSNDGDCLLQVESKTLDILLNQLPWGISMIKLPWMQRLLRVEWSH
jgi:hypothetical protein